MKYTFYLKQPKSPDETLIMFACYFKMENRKFVYSTGEKIAPDHWDQIARLPKKNKSKFGESIKRQLNRYSDLFLELESHHKKTGEEFNSVALKKAFDTEFKQSSSRNTFFDALDEFTNEKYKLAQIGDTTVKRYKNISNILTRFQKARKHPVNFASINTAFLAEFTDYCYKDLKHINTTFARNLGLIKTFLYWALENKYLHNAAFVKFKGPKKTPTDQIALTIEDLNTIMAYEFENDRLSKVRDVFVFSCVTGMRSGELRSVKKSNIIKDHIVLKETKDVDKESRRIPLTPIARFILSKYDYKLPLITNQKQNAYLKDVFKELGYTQTVQKTTVRAKDNVTAEMPLYDRISTHTARRTFITMMKRQGMSDKLIASITGHKDMKTLNQYYQVDREEKREAMDKVFNIAIPLRKA